MRRVLSLVAASSVLVSAADYDDDSEVNFLRMLTGNGSNTTVAPTTLAATTLAATTLAPTTLAATTLGGNATTLAATTLSANTESSSSNTEATKTDAPAMKIATQAPGAPAVAGKSVEKTTCLKLSLDAALGATDLYLVLQDTVVKREKAALATVDNKKVLRELAAHVNKTTSGGINGTAAPVTTFTGTAAFDSKWTKAKSGAMNMAATIPPASRRALAAVQFVDGFTFKVFSTDAQLVANVKKKNDDFKVKSAAGGTELAALQADLKAAVKANEALIKKDLPSFNATSIDAAITSMTVEVEVKAVKDDTSAQSNPTTATTSGATAQVTGLFAIALAAFASLF